MAFNCIKSYFLAGKLLHVITLVDLFICMMLMDRIPDIFRDGTVTMRGLYTALLLFVFSLLILSQLDARSRYQNYKQIKDQLFLFGFDTRIMNPVLKSRCQRDAALRAAIELGFAGQCLHHFRLNGYRWYHILPDYVFRKPQFLLSKSFLITTFFTPTYNQRVDYSTGTLYTRQIIKA
jgi:hypothetical protein